MGNTCQAARAGSVVMRFKNLPFVSVNLSFTGTGLATVDEEKFQTLAVQPDSVDEIRIDWERNLFVGEHWLIGKFKIELDPTQASFGVVRRMLGDNSKLENVNYFQFLFSFDRLGDRKFKCVTPIVNSAEISKFPPVGSTYKINPLQRDVKMRSVLGSDLFTSSPLPDIFPGEFEATFDFCEVTVYEKGNVEAELIRTSNIDERTRNVTVRLKNITSEQCKIAYFLVLHDKDLVTESDYGFVNMQSLEIKEFEMTIRSDAKKSYDIPFFAAVYEPERLRGSAELNVHVDFS